MFVFYQRDIKVMESDHDYTSQDKVAYNKLPYKLL